MNKTKKKSKKLFVAFLAVLMLFALIPIMPSAEISSVEAAETKLKNPRKDSNGEVTYDCVWFGSYPQAEVITTAMSKNYTAIKSEYLKEGDLIVDDAAYGKLKKATGWDANGDITLSNGDRYRRMRKSDATSSILSGEGYYNWSDSQTYHYFKYQPIKWRVLHADGKEALLMADKGLDDRNYNTERKDVTWETCTLRSFLNGYGSASNVQKEDYTKKNFINSTFTSDERNLIKEKTLENKDNPEHGTAGGKSTKDKVFLLSYDAVRKGSYGFSSYYTDNDKARRMQTSTYAKAMGAWWDTDTSYSGNGKWWLRSPGGDSNDVMAVVWSGYINLSNRYIFAGDHTLVPALYLNLSSSNLYSYAGTVCTNGNVNEVKKNVNEPKKNGLVYENGLYYYYKNNTIQTGFTGMVKNSTDSKWYYVEKSVCRLNRTGLVKDGSNWRYVKNSVWQSGYTGMVKNSTDGKWYYVENGICGLNHTGLVKDGSNWRYVKNSVWQSGYTGMVKNSTDGKWYYVENGICGLNRTCLVKDGSNWKYVKNSVWQSGYTGMVKQPSGRWYYVEKGRKKYVTQLVKHTDGSWWYVKNGEWQPSYKGMVKQPSGNCYYVENGKRKYVTQLVKHTDGSWWYVKKSNWQPKFTGIVKQPSGRRYYVENGKRKNITGYVTVKGKRYKLVKGEVK